MIRLNLPRGPYWIDLPFGVRVRVRPMTTAIREQAVARGLRLAAELGQHAEAVEQAGGAVVGLPELLDPDARAGMSQMLYVQGLAQAAILEWEGVLEQDSDDPAPVSDEKVAEVFAFFPAIADSFTVQYTAPMREAIVEGKGSRSSPGGTTGEAPIIAEGAGTKGSPARKARPSRSTAKRSAARTSNTSP
ncbi:hypothetical protein [Mycobacterium sp. KBS0706]|uniref:hypothetical protein n=1 Tax=Mycobacterium sp. KBS0706 TaxID=2578109 RepID=UPI00163DBBE5|nr:hypothetical protein [Mycobacterium sp. KBS0706]